MRKLDFLIAGVQKGETTALWHFLKQHPQIRFGQRKELHFFDNEGVDWSDPKYKILNRNYVDAPNNCILGDATPIYTYWPSSSARIRAYNANIKLIILLRDPISRAYSHWRMESGRGQETLGFSEAIRHGRDRIEAVVEGVKCHRICSYLERGLFAQQLDRIHRDFSQSQVLVLMSESLRLNQKAVIDEVTDFLDIQRFIEYPQDEAIFETETEASVEMSLDDLHY